MAFLSAPMPRTTVALGTLPSESCQASTRAPAAAGVCAPSKTITRVPSVIRSKRPGQLATASPVRIDSSGTRNSGHVHDVQSSKSSACVLDLVRAADSECDIVDHVPHGPFVSKERHVPSQDQSRPANLERPSPLQRRCRQCLCRGRNLRDSTRKECLGGRIPAFCQAMSAYVGPRTAVCSRSMRVMTETIGSMTLVES